MSKNVKGLKELIAVLEKIPKELDSTVDETLEANAQDIERNAKSKAPVDTGKLQQSIKALKESEKTYIIRANNTGKAPYAPFVEYGTRFQRAQPFLFPAFFAGRDRFVKDLKNLLDKTFDKI
jgi:HK97 gp10 family phage protein